MFFSVTIKAFAYDRSVGIVALIRSVLLSVEIIATIEGQIFVPIGFTKAMWPSIFVA